MQAHIIIKILLSFVTSSDLSNNLINKTLIEELKFRDYSAKSLVMFIYRYSDKYQSLQQEVASLLIDLLVRPQRRKRQLELIFRYSTGKMCNDPGLMPDSAFATLTQP